MSDWRPDAAPVGDASKVSQYTDAEIKACLKYAGVLLRDLPGDSKWVPKVEEWLGRLTRERADRDEQRRADRARL